MQIDRRIERVRPFYHRRIKMWMTNRNGGNAAESANRCDGRIVNQTDAVPQNIPGRSLDEIRLLPDGNLRLGANSREVRRDRAQNVFMFGAHFSERRPHLTFEIDILPIIFADTAMRGLVRRRGILCAACDANVFVHGIFYRGER